MAVHQGDPAEKVFLLASGHGRHFVLTSEGKKLSLHWLTAGQMFGGAAIVATPTFYLASTELLTNGCALVWDRKTIRELASIYPTLLENALSISVTEHLAWLVGAQVSLASDDARGRIAHLLLSLACGIGTAGPDGVELRVKNEDLAAGANVTLFTASRVLSEWQRAGVLTKHRGLLVMRRPDLLLASYQPP